MVLGAESDVYNCLVCHEWSNDVLFRAGLRYTWGPRLPMAIESCPPLPSLPAISNSLQDADSQLFTGLLTNTEHSITIFQSALVIAIITLGPACIIKNLYPKPVHLMIGTLLHACYTGILLVICLLYMLLTVKM